MWGDVGTFKTCAKSRHEAGLPAHNLGFASVLIPQGSILLRRAFLTFSLQNESTKRKEE